MRAKTAGQKPGCKYVKLLFFDFQDLHGTCLDADTAGNTLAGGALLGGDHDLHRADLNTLTAGGTQLLIDHVHAGLGILGDRASLTSLCALTALDADHGLCRAVFLNDPDAGQVLMELLIKSLGASSDTLQASHTLCALFHNELLHRKELSFFRLFLNYYTATFPK